MVDYVTPELQTDVESTDSNGEEFSNMAWTSDNSFLEIPDDDLPSTGGFLEPFDDDLSSSSDLYNLSANDMFSSSSDDGLDDVVVQGFWTAQLFGNTTVESESGASTESGTSTCSSQSDDMRSTEVSALRPPRSHVVAIDLGQLAAAQALDNIVPTEVTSGAWPPAALRQCTLVQHAKNEGHSLAERTSWSREKAGAEVAGSKQLVCPICAAPVIGPDDLRLQMKTVSKFAHYVPRSTVRQENRLGKWYAKYGYCGPDYCSVCAESFNSHLLKTAVRSKRVACTRRSPCVRCTTILSHFEVPKEAVFRASDGRKRRPRKKQNKLQGQEQNSQKQREQKIPPEPKRPPPPLHRPASESSESEKTSPLLNGMLTTQMGSSSTSNAGKRKRISLAFATVAAAVGVLACMVLSTAWWVGSGGTVQGPEQYIGDRGATEWVCGAAAAASINATFSPSYLASKCENLPGLSTFACPLNDCADGQVPIGERTCRCDGCFRVGGRCGGWVLEGYGPSPQENGCEVIDPDPSPYVWTIPGDLSSHQCSVMCGDTNGCYRHDSTKNPDPKREGELQCDLVFPRPWPQPLVADWELPNRFGGRYGYIWTTDGHGDAGRGEHTSADAEIWYNTIDDGGQIGRNTNVEYSTSSGRHALDSEAVAADLHITWKFDASEHIWQPLSSSLAVRPTPRVGAGRWVDSTGALFLVGGLYTGEAFGVRDGVLPFSSVDIIPKSVVENSTGLLGPSESDPSQLWRYDTSIAAWEQLHPTSATWPRSRCGATVWRDRAGESSVLQTKIWMFGGWLTIASNANSRSGTELWQYVYEYDRHNSSAPVPGQWTLVSAGVGCASQSDCENVGEVLYVCADQVEVDADGRIVRMPCPSARKDSGSWPSLNGGAGGWVFGGVTQADDVWSGIRTEQVVVAALNDLWHWNGDLDRPAWTQKTTTSSPLWPPGWQAPQGWASDSDGGELWLAGGSGRVHEFTQYDFAAQASDPVWRFSLRNERWERYQINQTTSAGLWPAPREAASITNAGLMFGGVVRDRLGNTNVDEECLGAPSAATAPAGQYSPYLGYASMKSGMWRWRDDAGSTFYQ